MISYEFILILIDGFFPNHQKVILD